MWDEMESSTAPCTLASAPQSIKSRARIMRPCRNTYGVGSYADTRDRSLVH